MSPLRILCQNICSFLFINSHKCFLFSFLFWDGVSLVAQARVQWWDFGLTAASALPGSSDSLPSASPVAGITGSCHQCPANFFVFLVETGFYHVGQASLELLTSGDPLALASQSAGITGVSCWDWPWIALNVVLALLFNLASVIRDWYHWNCLD